MKVKTVIKILAFLYLASNADMSMATMYCNRPYAELKKNPGRPYNAVGYLNNGCTAFLIDSNHIVAAAHCFVNSWSTGEWQQNLRFYPNFHPDRVTADRKHVPRADVTRAVVGSRAGEGVMGYSMDWGIARVDNWKDIEGLDLTPLRLASSMPDTGTELSNPAYTRHHFPYDDNNFITLDNMEWDNKNCSGVPPDGGIWAILMRPSPIVGFNRGDIHDIVGCNSRWGAGMLHDNCSLGEVINDVVTHNCDTVGGSSGSPIMYKNSAGIWNVIGVGHGGVTPTNFELHNAPICTDDDRHDNVGASVERFRNAPRFASNVAVSSRPDNASATAVFAIDSDLNRVVYRYRKGEEPSYDSQFSFWENIGTPPYRGTKLSKIAACNTTSTAGKSQIFVVVDGKKIYTRSVLATGKWGSWSNFSIPASVTKVTDIDTTTDANGQCQILIASNVGAFSRNMTPTSRIPAWTTVAKGSFKSITALNYNGRIWAALLNSYGEIWRTFLSKNMLGKNRWTSPIKLSRPAEVSAWRDIDMTLDEAGRGFMLAIPTKPTEVKNRLYFTPMYGASPWEVWPYFETHLWAPGQGTQDAPELQTITASTWMEDMSGTTSPVVFATDDKGNIYFVEYSRVGVPRWIFDWKSFYHESIVYEDSSR